jgi:hypothetical protein
MDRMHELLSGVAKAAGEKYDGKKRSELKDSDFLFPQTRSFPIVTPADVPDAISNFGRMKGTMDYKSFLRKLYNMCKRKGSDFVAALPESSKEQLGLNKKASNSIVPYSDLTMDNEFNDEGRTLVSEDDEYEDHPEEMDDLEEYKNSFYGMSVGSLKAIVSHAMDILENLNHPLVKENLTAAHLQGMIAVAEDHLRSIHDFVMFVDQEDDTDTNEQPENETDSVVNPINPTQYKKKKRVRIKDLPHYRYFPTIDPTQQQGMPIPTAPDDVLISTEKSGLWDNIRKKRERMGEDYKPAKPGDKGRPDSEQWKKLTK